MLWQVIYRLHRMLDPHDSAMEWEALTARLMIASGLSLRWLKLSVGSCVVVSRPDDCMGAEIGLH